MAVFLIAYDLNHETRRPKIVDEVKETDWARLSESSYAIDTNETAEEIYARFQYLLDENDDFYVIPLSKPYAGFGLEQVIEWLDKRLPRKG